LIFFTEVGSPLAGITTIVIFRKNLQSIASRGNPKFGILFSIIAYLAIGPLFQILRTGTISYKIVISVLDRINAFLFIEKGLDIGV
jgi:LIVCS family branched-chain amino acid:cation transporter